MAERDNATMRIDDAIKKIVDQFHPVKIILFGSHARGSADLHIEFVKAGQFGTLRWKP